MFIKLRLPWLTVPYKAILWICYMFGRWFFIFLEIYWGICWGLVYSEVTAMELSKNAGNPNHSSPAF
jgi:hypothetical protein